MGEQPDGYCQMGTEHKKDEGLRIASGKQCGERAIFRAFFGKGLHRGKGGRGSIQLRFMRKMIENHCAYARGFTDGYICTEGGDKSSRVCKSTTRSMSITNPDILAQLQRARTKKEKPAPQPKQRQPIKRGSPPTKGGKPKGRSEKMRGIMEAIKPLYEDFLEEHPICEIRGPQCTGQATCIHHVAGRSIKKVLDKKTWKASCSNCNLHVEIKDAEAREKGHKTSRLSK